MLRSRRRVGLRQVDGRAGDRPLPARATASSPAEALGRRHGRARPAAARRCAPTTATRSRWSTRTPARRSTRRCASSRQLTEVFELRGASRSQATARALEALWRSRSPTPLGHDALSAPALGRDAAARRDRDGARHRSQAARARRADDRPRRDRRGRGARPHHRAAGAAPHGGALHQPQPRRDRQDVPARRRALRRRSSSRRARSPTCCRRRAIPTPWACCAASRRRAAASRTAGSTRSPASCREIGTHLPGCVFVDRCALAQDICREQRPEPLRVGERHTSRCFFHEQAAEPAARHRRPRRAAGRRPSRRAAAPDRRSRQDVPPGRARHLRARRRLGDAAGRRDARARRRVGIRQDDVRPRAARHHRARRAARWRSTAASCRPSSPGARRRTSRRCRSSSRTPTRRSTAATASAACSARSLKKLLGLTGASAEQRAHELIDDVRLPQRSLAARPTQLSGGQKQRVAIARAFSGEPRLVVCDEPTSALDVSVQAAILNLLVDLQAEHRTSYVFISHDLGVVRYLSDRIAVLYLGRLMELGTAQEVFEAPHHPYTEALLSAVPSTDPGARRASSSPATSRRPRTRPPAASSRRAVRASSARSARTSCHRSRTSAAGG